MSTGPEYQCFQCKCAFAQYTALTQHRRAKNHTRFWKCPKCHSNMHNSADLEAHKAQCICYKCGPCKWGFTDKASCYEHVSTKHPDCFCKTCDMNFVSPKAKKLHLEDKHRYECRFCASIFQEVKHRERHYKLKHAFCTTCQREFSMSEHKAQHDRDVHLVGAGAVATISQAASSTASASKKGKEPQKQATSNLKITIAAAAAGNKQSGSDLTSTESAFSASQSGTTPSVSDQTSPVDKTSSSESSTTGLQCPHCTNVYADINTLIHHLSLFVTSDAGITQAASSSDGSEDTTDQWSCPACGDSFAGLDAAVSHYDAFHLLICSECKVVFERPMELYEHWKAEHHKHCESREEVCTHCSDRFATAEDLELHVMETHVCPVCEAEIVFGTGDAHNETTNSPTQQQREYRPTFEAKLTHMIHAHMHVCPQCFSVHEDAATLSAHVLLAHNPFGWCRQCFNSGEGGAGAGGIVWFEDLEAALAHQSTVHVAFPVLGEAAKRSGK